MNNIKISPSVDFPSWETIKNQNDITEYKGYEFKQQLSENLFVRISCQNENALNPEFDNIIHFSFCNRADFPISSVRYLYCEDGYYAGIRDLLKWAENFEKIFCAFRNKSGLG